MEGMVITNLKVLLHVSPEGTDKNYEKSQSGCLMIGHNVSSPSLSAFSDECTLPMSFESCH